MLSSAGKRGTMLLTESGQAIPCICITNRRLCKGDFYEKIKEIAAAGVADAIILREKDLPEETYFQMADRVVRICEEFQTPCILHTYVKSAQLLHCQNIHLPLGVLEKMEQKEKDSFEKIGSSVHSLEQAERAYELGADYVTAGHVFETDCKKGIPGRGTGFLSEICKRIRIPIYGIGGVSKENAESIIKAGAKGVCLMSGFMNGTL